MECSKTGPSIGNIRAAPCASQERRSLSAERDNIHLLLDPAHWKTQHVGLQPDMLCMPSPVSQENKNFGKNPRPARHYLDLACSFTAFLTASAPRWLFISLALLIFLPYMTQVIPKLKRT